MLQGVGEGDAVDILEEGHDADHIDKDADAPFTSSASSSAESSDHDSASEEEDIPDGVPEEPDGPPAEPPVPADPPVPIEPPPMVLEWVSGHRRAVFSPLPCKTPLGSISVSRIGEPREAISLYCKRHKCTVVRVARQMPGDFAIAEWFRAGMAIPEGREHQAAHKGMLPILP